MFLQLLDCLEKCEEIQLEKQQSQKWRIQIKLILHHKRLLYVFCYIQIETYSKHFNYPRKTVICLEAKFMKIIGHEYNRQHTEILKYLTQIMSHFVLEILNMGHMKIRDDTRIKTDIKYGNTLRILAKYHKRYFKTPKILMNEDSRNISFDRKRELEVLMGVIKRAEIHEEPMPPLKAASNYEDDVKEILN
ncbi:hypothetical protein CWI38_0158p0010 [Hamiltosporidium tvaerminnensis]|uniref:Uncharacterized protein n=1 Tax=Hamiltosporidium tvaerminnensis TaxID=1176355 RepID=A0A4Q9M1Z1_9MICR|nr:hypothetical protein CWI38_0158p0010 [Hamiltosporidium tvaerminnensis]